MGNLYKVSPKWENHSKWGTLTLHLMHYIPLVITQKNKTVTHAYYGFELIDKNTQMERKGSQLDILKYQNSFRQILL